MAAQTENKVLFGLSNVHVAFQTEAGKWETPKPIPGAVNMSIDPEGDQEVFYADNTAYYTANANAGYSGELEIALVPNDVLAKMLGWEIDANGALVEISDGVPTPFALLFNVQGDQRARSTVYYNVTGSRPSDEWSTTEDATSVTTLKLPFTATPAALGGKSVVKSVIEKNDANASVYGTFFTKVYEPGAVAEA